MAATEPVPHQVLGQFDVFYRDRYRSVVALIYALTGNRWAAEDLAQEAFLRAHRDWRRVQSMAAPGAWVRRVAINLAMSRFRRLKSETAARLKFTNHAISFEPPPAEHDEFWAEVRKLPSRQSQVIALFYLEDLTTKETAQAMGIAEGTVRALLAQARDRLATRLEAKGWDSDGH